ncbi:MAG: Gfo/Idh/MocA family protein [Aestuariivirga sp.]
MQLALSTAAAEVALRQVKIAVAGAGDIGRRHMGAICEDPGCTLVAIVDPQPNGAMAAERFQTAHYSDLAQMIDAAEPDGVIIAAPNALHVPLAELCIARRIPVLVEKPISDDTLSAYALADLAETAGVPVLVGHHRRHNPIIRRAREIVESGTLGEITAVSAAWLVRKPDDYFNVRWRSEPGGGPILINLIHDIDCLRFLAGEIVAVQATTSNRRRGLRVEDSAAVLITFANGALGTLVLSDATPSPWSWELTSGETTSYAYPRVATDCYRISGSRASLGVPTLRMWRHDSAQSWQSPILEERHPVAEEDPLRLQIRHFVEVIRGKSLPVITARDAARTLEVTLAVTKSAQTRTAVDIRGGAG